MPLAAGAAGGGRAVDRRAARGHGGDGRGSSPRAGSQGYGDRRAGGDDCRAGGPDRSAGAQAGPRLLELAEAAVTGSPYAKKSTDRSLREKTGRKPGRQPGAPGRTSGLSDDPDETIECAPAECGRCGRDLTGEPAARTAAGLRDLPAQLGRAVRQPGWRRTRKKTRSAWSAWLRTCLGLQPQSARPSTVIRAETVLEHARRSARVHAGCGTPLRYDATPPRAERSDVEYPQRGAPAPGRVGVCQIRSACGGRSAARCWCPRPAARTAPGVIDTPPICSECRAADCELAADTAGQDGPHGLPARDSGAGRTTLTTLNHTHRVDAKDMVHSQGAPRGESRGGESRDSAVPAPQ